MKKIFTLIAACVFTAMSAWADDVRTLVYENDFETTGWNAKGRTDGYTCNPGTTAANSYGSKVLCIGSGGGDMGLVSPSIVFGEGIDASIVDVEMKFKMDACTNGKSSGIEFITSDVNINNGYVSAGTPFFGINASANGNGYWGTMTAGGENIMALNGTGTFENNALNRNTTGVVTLKARFDFTKKTTTFSLIKNGNTVLDSKKVSFANTNATTLDRIFIHAGKSYGTVSIDDVKVYAVTVEEPEEEYTYSVNAVDGNNVLLKTFESGICTSKDNKTVFYPYAINIDGSWYTTNETTFGKTITANGAINITYTKKDNIVFFSEGEGGYANVWKTDASNSSGNICNNNDGRTSGSALNTQDRGLTIGTLPAGNYRLFVSVVGKNKRGIVLRSGTTIISAVDNSTATSGIKSVDFVLTEETGNLLLNGNNNGSKSTQLEDIDYFYIVKTAEPITVNDNGTASYVAPCNLDFEGSDLKAYVATAVSETTITLVEVTKVAAGEAIVVKGESCNVNVIAEADAPATNLFKAGAYTVEAGDNIFALSKNDGKFHKVAEGVTIPEGKAYIALPATESKAISLNFDGDVTGIKTTTAAKQNTNAYNLFGQKVSANAKGIVIINGKKINNK